MLGLAYLAEINGSLAFTALICQFWVLPFVIVLYVLDINQMNHWVAWGIMTLFMAYPSGKPATAHNAENSD